MEGKPALPRQSEQLCALAPWMLEILATFGAIGRWQGSADD
jgi:hypothetical protein